MDLTTDRLRIRPAGGPADVPALLEVFNSDSEFKAASEQSSDK